MTCKVSHGSPAMGRRKRRSWCAGRRRERQSWYAEARKEEPRTPSEASDSSEDLPDDRTASMERPRQHGGARASPQQPPLPLAFALYSCPPARRGSWLREDRMRLQEVLEEPEEEREPAMSMSMGVPVTQVNRSWPNHRQRVKMQLERHYVNGRNVLGIDDPRPVDLPSRVAVDLLGSDSGPPIGKANTATQNTQKAQNQYAENTMESTGWASSHWCVTGSGGQEPGR